MSAFLYFFHPHNLHSLEHFFSILIFILFLLGVILCYRNRKKTILINLTFFFFLLIPIFYYIETNHPSFKQKRFLIEKPESPFSKEDPTYGTRANSGIWQDSVSFKDQLIYKKNYTIDENGLRQTNKNAAEKILLFYGCSQTFGQGVDDHETYPSLIQALLPEYQSINLGLTGAGTTHTLRLIEKREEEKYLGKKIPVHAFYGFIPSHMKRNDFTLNWVQPSPWFELKPNGELLDKGIFIPKENMTLNLFLKHWKSYFLLRLFSKHEDYSKEEQTLFLRLIQESQKKLKQHYPNITFTVIFLYDDFLSQEMLDELERELKRSGINFINIPKLLPQCMDTPQTCLYLDGHFNPLGHKLIAEQLTKFLGQKK